MKRFIVEKELSNGWSRWVQPVKRNYLMACCDCGLVHRMSFRVVSGRAQFKAQRAPRLTAARRMKSKEAK